MSYAIISQEKIKDFKSIKAHNERTFLTDNINKELIYKNITLVKNKYKSQEQYLKIKSEEIKQANKTRTKKMRTPKKDAAISQELIFTHSPGAMTEIESVDYLNKAFEFVKERFPNNEILGAYIHLDETTPHIHIDVSYYDEVEKRFNQRDMYKSKLTDINEIRKAFMEYISEDYPMLKKQDGSIVDKQQHQSKANKEIAKLKEELKEKPKEKEVIKNVVDTSKIEELEKKISQLEERLKSSQEFIEKLQDDVYDEIKQNQVLTEHNKRLIDNKNDLSDKCIALEEKINSRQSIEHEFDELKETNTILKERLDNQLKSNQTLQSENISLKNEINLKEQEEIDKLMSDFEQDEEQIKSTDLSR